MKNKLILYIVLFCIIIIDNSSISDEFTLKSEKIDVLESGSIIEASGNVEIITDNDLDIKSNKSVLNKTKSFLEASGNVKIFDKKNDLLINANYVSYDKNKDLIFIEDKSETSLKKEYKLKTSNLFFDRKNKKIFTNEKGELTDLLENKINFDSFELDLHTEVAKIKNFEFIDINNNNFFLDSAEININKKEIIGDNAELYFDKKIFGNSENDPRIFGKTLKDNEIETVLTEAEFTSCKIRKNEKCPPWILKAKEVKHNKKSKLIEYKKAWLKIYDKPVLYFPFFYHPDPTVKRQSGFLMPKISNSSFLGSSLQIPYYNVIADNKDLTVSPRIFFNNSLLFQSEYREVGKYSNSIFDHSILLDSENGSKSHFFSNYQRENLDKVEINLETTSNKNYLKKYDVVSPIIKSQTTLNSFFSYENSNKDSYFTTSVEVFEDLTQKDSDSYEYIYPNYMYSKDILISSNGNFKFKTYGFQKKYETNKYDGLIINDISYDSISKISKNGFQNNFSFILKNVNTDGENSDNYKNNTDNKILTGLVYNSKIPMFKSSEDKTQYFTPIFSARYSPSETKNIQNDENRLNYINIFSFNRLNKNDMIEGGESFTLGGKYQYQHKNEKLADLSLGQVFRLNENEDLPDTSSIGEKRSDIVGSLNLSPKSNFNLSYAFSADSNLNDLNYNFVETDIKVNNLITSFKFLEDKNKFGDKSFISNETKYSFDKNNSLSFSTNKNLDINLTEYYDLIYEYRNDCFSASVEYKKTYYNDVDLTPDENIFFSIKIIPFGNINTPTLK